MHHRVKIKLFITFEGNAKDPNSFRVSTGNQYSMYRPKTIEIRGDTWKGSLVSQVGDDIYSEISNEVHTILTLNS
jgi:hypothetical protein